MQLTKNRFLLVIFAGVLFIFMSSCGVTYNDMTLNIEKNVVTGNFSKASAEIEDNKFLQKKRNRLLYLMEKGKVEHMAGNYRESNKLLEEAYIIIDDYISTNVGQAVAAKLTNPMAAPYKGEDFEKVTIHYYKALNYFNLNQPNEALVEAKRINIKLQELNQRYKKAKNKYTEDAFAQILQGILYEATNDINNAFIAYRNAANLYLNNNGSYYGVPLPYQLKLDLLRTSKQMGFTEEYRRYQKEFNIPESELEVHTAEAIVFWENGIGPAKDQTTITAVDGAFVSVSDSEDGIVIPIPPGTNLGITAIAIPKYQQRESFYNRASLQFNGQEKSFSLAEDYFPIARQTLHDRMLREAVDIALRLGSKKAASAGLGALAKEFLGEDAGDIVKIGSDIAGAATERADTRNWQTLPATISYVRVPLEEGKNTFTIKKYGKGNTVDQDVIEVDYKKGLQLVSYFDLWRTTTNYVQPKEKIKKDDIEQKTKETETLTSDNEKKEEDEEN